MFKYLLMTVCLPTVCRMWLVFCRSSKPQISFLGWSQNLVAHVSQWVKSSSYILCQCNVFNLVLYFWALTIPMMGHRFCFLLFQEICVGILGNIACFPDTCLTLSQNEDLGWVKVIICYCPFCPFCTRFVIHSDDVTPCVSTVLCCCSFLEIQILQQFWKQAGDICISTDMWDRTTERSIHLFWWCLQVAADVCLSERCLFPVASASSTADVCALQPPFHHVQLYQQYSAFTHSFLISWWRVTCLGKIHICLTYQDDLYIVRVRVSFLS